jgi:glycosyltransferase involved in cell wall biosynthesis
MKFQFISTMNDFPWGGSEELWSQAAVQLRQEGHEVRISVAYWPQKVKRVAYLKRLGIQVEYHFSHWPDLPALHKRVWNRISASERRRYARLRRHRPDLVILSQGYNVGGFDWVKVCRDASIRYAIIVHCNSELWWFRQLEEAIASYTFAQRIFCVSQHNLALLRIQLGETLPNAEIVRNPCNVVPGPCLSWPDAGGMWRLACVGRLDPAAKGQDLLLQVLARPEWRDRPVELNLFGTGPFEATLQRMASMLQLNNVHFRGHVSDIKKIWEHNHLLVLPSRYEGLPLALVEAMWCCRPAVVTDVGGNAELCAHGLTGFVASAATPAAYSEALERAWQHREEWAQLGHAARHRVENLIPEDPVGLFCERLKQLAATGSAAGAARL